MPTSFAVIGPGKVGQALARRWREAGYRLLGFFGGREASRQGAVEFAGGRSLAAWKDLAEATVVLLSVPDAAIATAAQTAAQAGAVRPCALWLHASGATGLEPLQPLVVAGARAGSLHPLCPFPSVDVGYQQLGLGERAALIDGPPASRRLLHVLARAAGLQPITLTIADRALYHASCALAANGITVLRALATSWFSASLASGAAPAEVAAQVDAMVSSLLRGALAASDELGAQGALTGPAARGDAAMLQRHLDAASAAAVPGRDAFVALMRQAATIAQARGDLSEVDVARVARALEAFRG